MMKIKQSFLLLLLYMGLCVQSTTLVAAAKTAKTYQIEMIIFTQINSDHLQQEQWPISGQTTVWPKRLITLQPSVTNKDSDNQNLPFPQTEAQAFTPTKNFQLLPNSALTLKKEFYMLKKNPEYRVIQHIAWLQQPSNRTQSVHIYGGNTYQGQQIQVYGTREYRPYDPNVTSELDGYISIQLQRYFNVTLNLQLSEPSSRLDKITGKNIFDTTQTPLFYFRFNQTRRTRSNELNYIDHPLLGVLLKITPVKDEDN